MGRTGKLTGRNDVPPLHITVRAHDRAPVRVSVTGKGVRTAVWRDDAWSEEDHPRGKGGQFSSGGTAHVVASHNPENGNIVLHGVHGEREHAVKHQAETLKKQYAKADRDYDHESNGHPTAYQNAAHAKSVLSALQQPHAHTKAVEVKGKAGSNGDLHIVAEGEHSGGVKIHGAYTSREEAEAHAERLSKAAWENGGDYRSEITQREVNAARRDFNKDKPASKQVSAEEADNQSHPEFEKFLEKRHPMDETLPHPGLKKANQFFVEQGVEHGKAGGTGVIRVLQHKASAK